jgi:hypothetical protein
VKFTEYPTREDRKRGKNGAALDGQAVRAAPGGGQWVLTPADQTWHLVRTRLGVATSVAEENPR